MRLKLTAIGLAALIALPAQAVDPGRHTQLIASAGLSAEEAAKLTLHQIVMVKQIRQNSTYSEGEKHRRVKWILEGTVPRFQFGF